MKSVKVALWCRWFHRWRWPKAPQRVVSTYPGAGRSLAMTAGPGRDYCWACEDEPKIEMTRRYREWLAS